jgi:hypothetical protein
MRWSGRCEVTPEKFHRCFVSLRMTEFIEGR